MNRNLSKLFTQITLFKEKKLDLCNTTQQVRVSRNFPNWLRESQTFGVITKQRSARIKELCEQQTTNIYLYFLKTFDEIYYFSCIFKLRILHCCAKINGNKVKCFQEMSESSSLILIRIIVLTK